MPDESPVTANRTEQGIRITGVRAYLGYTNVVVLPDSDARTLVAWLKRDGNDQGANVIEQVLRDG